MFASQPTVSNVPDVPSEAKWNEALPRLEVWNCRLAVWLAELVSCSNPLAALKVEFSPDRPKCVRSIWRALPKFSSRDPA